jgi:hypothetical protein
LNVFVGPLRRPHFDRLSSTPRNRRPVAIYLPMRLTFGDSSWLEPGGYPLPIQTSRILLYAGYFFTGVSVRSV